MHETQQTRPRVPEAKVSFLLVGLPRKSSVEDSGEYWHKDDESDLKKAIITYKNYILAVLIKTIERNFSSLECIRGETKFTVGKNEV